MKGYEVHQNKSDFLIPEFSLFMHKSPQTFKIEKSAISPQTHLK